MRRSSWLCATGLLAGLLSAAAGEIPQVTPAEAARRVASGQAVLVDVREPREWAETGVAALAVLLPKSDFDNNRTRWTPFLANKGRREILLYCRSGHRAEQVAIALAKEGFRTANVGGFGAWLQAGLPVRSYRLETSETPPPPPKK